MACRDLACSTCDTHYLRERALVNPLEYESKQKTVEIPPSREPKSGIALALEVTSGKIIMRGKIWN
jgi:hypothetical protein